MANTASAKISITIPTELLDELEELAKHNYASRSGIIRLALLEYIRKPENDVKEIKRIRKVRQELNQQELDRLRAAHPEIPPDDIQLLKVLDDFDKEQKASAGKA